jgi:hypothetical protein
MPSWSGAQGEHRGYLYRNASNRRKIVIIVLVQLELLYIALFSVSDEKRSCIEEATVTNKLNKFNRCWRGIKYKVSELPAMLEWNVHAVNRTEQETPPQNRTAQTMVL